MPKVGRRRSERRRRCGVEGGVMFAGIGRLRVDRAEAAGGASIAPDILLSGARREFFISDSTHKPLYR